MKKSELMAACKDYGLDFDGVPTKPVVWASLKDFISRNIPAEVEKMDTERGHVVAWTPPYHPDLQPIELVWSDVKGKVGRQYTATTSFEDVRRRLDSAFDELPSRTIYNCITHTENMVKEMNKYLEQLDEADDDAEESGDALSSDEVSDNSESDFEKKE
ncbi:unnamed protein product [Aphanomyces euteiches]